MEKALAGYGAVILTGGSSGLGKSFIATIGKVNPTVQICNLSRRPPAIETGLKLRHFECDLGKEQELAAAAEGVRALLDGDAAKGKVLLINNSGFGAYGCFPAPSIEHQLDMIDVNVRAVVQLTGKLLDLLLLRGGGIVNIASTAAFQPTPYMATYGASKAFLLHWSLALNQELRPKGVFSLAVCPGPTDTEFFQRAGVAPGSTPLPFVQRSEEVVSAALKAVAAERALVVSGWKNKVIAAAGSTAPKRWAAAVSGRVIGRMRRGRRS